MEQSNQGLIMGEQKTVFGPNQANARIFLFVIPVFVLVGFILIFPIPIGGIAMFLIAGGLFWGYRAQMKARAVVYERGVAATDWQGRSHSFYWEDVVAVYEFIGYDQRTWRPTQWVYTVHLKDGRQVKLDMAYEKIRSLGAMVMLETGRLILPQALEVCRAGRTVAFGDAIGLSAAGFVSEGQTLAWDQVEKIAISKDGNLTLRKKGQVLPWKLVMHSHIANFPSFQTLLHEIVRGTPAEVLLDVPLYQRTRRD